jgi:glycine/sarcosine N-methyltransferase
LSLAVIPVDPVKENTMYDAFSSDYDRFVNWQSRLAYEMPFIEKLLAGSPSDPALRSQMRVLDAACGTGMHAVELARRGFSAAGADLSVPMIDRARANAAAAGVDVSFVAAGFGELAQALGLSRFNALLCLGNSLPHLLTPRKLSAALADFAACLQPGGLLLLQNRNFDAVMASRQRWMEPQAFREGEAEWVFVRFYDYEADGLINFNILTLKRQGTGAWTQQAATTRLRPLLEAELITTLEKTGFTQITCYGGMDGTPFDAKNSGNLVVTARRV